jgi:hypothetical protein
MVDQSERPTANRSDDHTNERGAARGSRAERGGLRNLAAALLPLFVSLDEMASFALESFERGAVLARRVRDAARAAARAAGGRTSTRTSTRRVPTRVPASPIVTFSDLDRQRARGALGRANLQPLKRSS